MKIPLNWFIWWPWVISVAVVVWQIFVGKSHQSYPFLVTLPFLFNTLVFQQILIEVKKAKTCEATKRAENSQSIQ